MNVLWLAHAIPYPPHAGFLSRSYNLLRELARRQNVDLIAFIQEQWVETLFPTLTDRLEESRRGLQHCCHKVTFLRSSRRTSPAPISTASDCTSLFPRHVRIPFIDPTKMTEWGRVGAVWNHHDVRRFRRSE
jgi:hypothetical protein